MSKSLANSTQLTELLNTIKSKISHKSWDTVICQTNILIDGKPKTIISYLNRNLANDATTTDIQLNESNVLEVLHLVYTAFKCEYASFVRDLLNFFFQYISICEINKYAQRRIEDCSHEKIIAKFINFKQNIGKMIFNLFNFMDLSQYLILSDQTFLKSLISINLFLYYHQNLTNVKWTIILLKKVIVQIKDLVDHFRCKNCFVGYVYFNDLKNNVTSDIMTKIQELYDSYSFPSKSDRFDDIGFQNNLFDVEMYDPKYLLVTELFEIDKDFFNDHLKLYYENILNSYDINAIFQYQCYIRDTVKIIIYREFREILVFYVTKFNSFNNYKIPTTFLSDFYKLLDEKKKELKDEINNFSMLSDLNQHYFFEEIMKLLKFKESDFPQSSKYKDTLFPTIGLIIKIVNSVHFKSFLQTLEIFEQESNSNDDYDLLTMDAYTKIKEQVDGDEDMNTASCKATFVLREILVSINLLVNVLKKNAVCFIGDDSTAEEQCLQDNLRLHLTRVFQCISNLIESTIDKKLQQMLWPILFYLENTRWIYYGVNDDEEYTQHVTIHQYVLMTLGSIERYELRNCKWPKYNQKLYEMAVYADIKSYPEENYSVKPSTAEDVIDRWRALRAFNRLQYNHVNYSSITYIHNSMFNEILSYFSEIYSKNYQFYWYGKKKNIYNILQAVTQNVIDYHVIARYQLIMIQWIISTVYIRLAFILKICPLKKTDINLIKKHLKEIREEFNAPEPLKEDFNNTIDRYLGVIKNNITFDLEGNEFNDFIIKKFELFDFAAIEAELRAENVCSKIKEYFEIIKSKLILMSNNYNNYNSNKSEEKEKEEEGEEKEK